ncbi:DNA-3-methyladenine glycosylase I [Pleionea sediminis]|uniref:DNA-3-methyladenine glycosylase I n=1 Tax=Pleionea sediminis TaxID=2569479 RepID=UPI001FE6C9E2|nr:DNA-3-methyladenine glycosylase I [Pleionea sediminis]
MKNLEDFEVLYERASNRKGGDEGLEAIVSEPLNDHDVSELPDSFVLSELSKKVFQSGFVWRVVRNKWPEFEEVFFGFDIDKLLMMPPDMLERKASDERIIRNLRKVKSIQNNALMIDDIRREHGSIAQWISDWPGENIVGLWEELKKKGDRLGGNTGPYALRAIGKDTFLLSRDVEAYFRNHKLIDGGLRTKKSLATIQSCFNNWQDQSGRSLQAISQIISYGIGDNFV